jgi:hypothetical protein
LGANIICVEACHPPKHPSLQKIFHTYKEKDWACMNNQRKKLDDDSKKNHKRGPGQKESHTKGNG